MPKAARPQNPKVLPRAADGATTALPAAPDAALLAQGWVFFQAWLPPSSTKPSLGSSGRGAAGSAAPGARRAQARGRFTGRCTPDGPLGCHGGIKGLPLLCPWAVDLAVSLPADASVRCAVGRPRAIFLHSLGSKPSDRVTTAAGTAGTPYCPGRCRPGRRCPLLRRLFSCVQMVSAQAHARGSSRAHLVRPCGEGGGGGERGTTRACGKCAACQAKRLHSPDVQPDQSLKPPAICTCHPPRCDAMRVRRRRRTP